MKRAIVQHPLTLTALGLGAIMLNPYWYFFPLAWIGFGLICIPVIRSPHLKRDAFLGYIAGLGFWCSRIHSIVPAYGWEMFIKCILLGALPWALFTIVVSVTTSRTRTEQIFYRIGIPTITWTILVAAFKASSVDSFPTEFMFYQPLAFMQVAAIPHGLTAFIGLMMLTNVAFAHWIVHGSHRVQRTLVVSITVGLLVGASGLIRLHINPIAEGNIPVAIIQTNLPISYEWRVDNGDEVLRVYREMALDAAKNNPAMIFFSQYSFSMFYTDEETIDFFSTLAKDTGAYIAIGTYTDRLLLEGQEEAKRYNISYVFSPEDGLTGSYRAASNLPFRKIGAVFGETFDPIETPIGTIGIMLCYDDVVRRVSKKWTEMGVDALVVLSNPSTFSSPVVHSTQLIQDQFRAIETGKEIIRSSTNGVSGVVDPLGRWRVRSKFDEQTVLYTMVSGAPL